MTILAITIGVYAFFLLILCGAEIRHQQKNKTSSFKGPDLITLSVIIPFRNEAQRLPALIDSLKRQCYEHVQVEFIFVNDHSQDEGPALIPTIIGESKVALLHLNEELGKKAAISTARALAQHEWVACVDADVTLPDGWLQAITAEIRNHPTAGMLVLPVSMGSDTFWGHFFAWEFIWLRQISVILTKHPLMANAANLVIHAPTWKVLATQVKGASQASGDDVFLLQAFNKHPSRKPVCPQRSAGMCAQTAAPDTFSKGIHQRVRWLRKPAMFSGSPLLSMIALAFWLGNLAWIFSIGFLFFQPIILVWFLLLIFSIPVISLAWTVIAVRPFNEHKLILAFPYILLIYGIYAFLLPFVAFCMRPTWKGRSV
jgi:cellulose synthase/poly-beta-1,6-N-acetylglucosamine synthase-like glycosyltransferase